MLPTTDALTKNKSLDEFLNLLSKSELVDGVLIMGSSANGTMNQFSDIDLAIIVKKAPANTLGFATFVEHKLTEVYLYTIAEIQELLERDDINPYQKEGWLFNWIKDGKIIIDKSGLLAQVKDKSLTLNLDNVFDSFALSSIGKVNYNYVQNKRYFDSGSELYLKALEVRLLYCLAEVFVAYFNVRKIHWLGEKNAFKYLLHKDQEFLKLFEDYQTTIDINGKMTLYQQLAELALKPAGGLWKTEVVSVMAEGNFTKQTLEKSLDYWKIIVGV